MKRIRSTLCMASMVAALGVASGCESDHSSIRGVGSSESRSLNAQRSSFDGAADTPFNAETHFAAAQLAESQGATGRAVEQYRAALKIDPNHAASLYRLGVIHTQLKDYPEAITVWNRYVKATHGSAAGYGNLGFCCELSGSLAEAEGAYRAGIAKDPQNAACRVNFGLMLARAGRLDEARAELAAVLVPAEVHYNVGSILERQGGRDQARAEYKKAMELDPSLDAAKARLEALAKAENGG